MDDPCFWCHKNHCQENHGLERAAYVTALHFGAIAKLGLGRRYQNSIAALMVIKPDQLTMEQHRIKGFFIRYRKTTTDDLAYDLALKEVEKVQSRSRYIFPEFSRADRLKINRYRPRHREQDWSYFK